MFHVPPTLPLSISLSILLFSSCGPSVLLSPVSLWVNKREVLCLYNRLNCQFIFTFKIDKKGEEVGLLLEGRIVYMYICVDYIPNTGSLRGK